MRDLPYLASLCSSFKLHSLCGLVTLARPCTRHHLLSIHHPQGEIVPKGCKAIGDCLQGVQGYREIVSKAAHQIVPLYLTYSDMESFQA